ncbi:hypothetical protein L289_0911 [Acinetobacter gerneri DSM 14967 = CIP 107464 = MTCC 9824]|nr:hypothetical protein L289_0911 [Acinetobacter gerneri DSM 14967 = CIP 107464 = MTCC 9824]
MTPKVLLAATPWLTTEAKDQNAQAVALDDARAKNYVGYAYFKKDGSFKIADSNPKCNTLVVS